MDVKTALREEEILPAVSLKTHAQSVRYPEIVYFLCYVTVTRHVTTSLVLFL